MAQTQFLPDASGSTKRPDIISVLGILTFLNTGIFILLYLFGVFGMIAIGKMPQEEFMQLLQDGAGKYMPADQTGMLDEIGRVLHASGVSLMLIYLIRTVGRLAGALGMWKGRKAGFYIYAAFQLVGLFAPHLILPWSMLGMFGPFMTVAITAAYGSQLKRMS